MAEGLNRVLLLGNLGADPELRHTQGGSAVLNMRLATSESYLDRDRNRKERTEWHNITVWGKRAEGLATFLRKGSRIFVEGGLRTSSYEDRQGQKRYKTEINATQIIVAGGDGRRSEVREPAERDQDIDSRDPYDHDPNANGDGGGEDFDDIPF